MLVCNHRQKGREVELGTDPSRTQDGEAVETEAVDGGDGQLMNTHCACS